MIFRSFTSVSLSNIHFTNNICWFRNLITPSQATPHWFIGTDKEITPRKHIEILCRKRRVLNGSFGLTDRREIDALDVWLHLTDFDKIVPTEFCRVIFLVTSYCLEDKVVFCMVFCLKCLKVLQEGIFKSIFFDRNAIRSSSVFENKDAFWWLFVI